MLLKIDLGELGDQNSERSRSSRRSSTRPTLKLPTENLFRERQPSNVLNSDVEGVDQPPTISGIGRTRNIKKAEFSDSPTRKIEDRIKRNILYYGDGNEKMKSTRDEGSFIPSSRDLIQPIYEGSFKGQNQSKAAAKAFVISSNNFYKTASNIRINTDRVRQTPKGPNIMNSNTKPNKFSDDVRRGATQDFMKTATGIFGKDNGKHSASKGSSSVIGSRMG